MGTEISDRPDAVLVRDAKSGSPEAFNALVRRWERKVYSFLVYLTGRPEDAFDMCQEVFLSGYRHLGQLKDPDEVPSVAISHCTQHRSLARSPRAGSGNQPERSRAGGGFFAGEGR